MPDETIWNFVLKVYTCVYGTSNTYTYTNTCDICIFRFMMRT